MKIVLQKYIADSGLCSRRKAEELIKQSISLAASVETRHASSLPVLVNGKVPELGMKVDKEDEVLVNGKKIGSAEKHIYIILNKPKGYTCTNRNFKDEKNVFELINVKERLFAVGRLDKQSRGLVLLTNDGSLAEKMTHPRYAHEKEYEVKCRYSSDDLRFSEKELKNLKNNFKKGILEDGEMMKAKKVDYKGEGRFRFVLTEGKKRQIRRMFRAFGLQVIDLKRVRIGNIKLGDLNEGGWKNINNRELDK